MLEDASGVVSQIYEHLQADHVIQFELATEEQSGNLHKSVRSVLARLYEPEIARSCKETG